ncbi:hypothetical protein JW968_03680 [Candidatus Woesearchaeota archaeon]|nr:hypothetical protein [Candidatus Woesearchaeota archaeon]
MIRSLLYSLIALAVVVLGLIAGFLVPANTECNRQSCLCAPSSTGDFSCGTCIKYHTIFYFHFFSFDVACDHPRTVSCNDGKSVNFSLGDSESCRPSIWFTENMWKIKNIRYDVLDVEQE